MAFKLDPWDEYPHSPNDQKSFNESMYFNFYDKSQSMGGFFRIGNRPNEKYAEVTACLYLSDLSVGFYFTRPEILNNDEFKAGGFSLEVINPFEKLRAEYENKVLILKDPWQLDNPSVAFKTNPMVNCKAKLELQATADAFGGVSENVDNDIVANFAKGHYEQLIKVTGEIDVNEHNYQINGLGLRDHSWGPRSWHAPNYYRWLTANFTENEGMVVSIITLEGGYQIKTGFYYNNGLINQILNAHLDTEWDKKFAQKKLEVKIELANSKQLSLYGEVINNVPLRHVKFESDGSQTMTRIAEGLTKWQLDNQTGFGWAEYLDRIIKGVPAGY
jgi:hypothetical protein